MAVPTRFKGTDSILSRRCSGSAKSSAIISVSITPGCTEFARIPSFTCSIAVDFVKILTAPLEAW